MCHDQVPHVDDNDATISYAFAAAPGTGPLGTCGTCYEISFNGFGHFLWNDPGSQALYSQGKRLIILASNIGYDVAGNQFDIMIPGGGVGAFDACSRQWDVEARGVSLGVQYGGFISECQKGINIGNATTWAPYPSYHEALKQCVRHMCETVFPENLSELANFRRGCLWQVDWYEVADNPATITKPVECPTYLKDRAGPGAARQLSDLGNTGLPPPPPSEPPSSPPPPLPPAPPGGFSPPPPSFPPPPSLCLSGKKLNDNCDVSDDGAPCCDIRTECDNKRPDASGQCWIQSCDNDGECNTVDAKEFKDVCVEGTGTKRLGELCNNDSDCKTCPQGLIRCTKQSEYYAQCIRSP